MAYPHILAVVLWAAAAAVDVVGVRLLVRGARSAGHPDQSRRVVKGFRRLILGGGLICFGQGLWLDKTALHAVGLVFLGEELVETQLMTWAVRRRGCAATTEPSGDDADSC